MSGMMPSVRPAGATCASPRAERSGALGDEYSGQCFRPARAKAYIIGAMYGRIVNAGSYAFALAGRKLGTDDNTQGAATLCPGLRAGCPFGAHRRHHSTHNGHPAVHRRHHSTQI